MKKLLLIAISLCSLNAFGSKARLQALANSPHLIDPQTLFGKSLNINELDNLISLESGLSAPVGGTDNAEGMFSYALSEKTRVLVSIGHQDEAVIRPRTLVNNLGATSYKLSQNPLHIFYGLKGEDTNYAMEIFYSKSDDKLNSVMETSSGFSLGTEMGSLQLYTTYTFSNSAEAAGGMKFDGAGYLSANIYYSMDSTSLFFTWAKSRMKSSSAGVENEFHGSQVVYLGIVDSKVKDENDFFWGAQVVSTKIDCHTRASISCDKAFTNTNLPVWFGVEAQVKPWLAIRGSLTQTVLIDQSKDEVGYPAASVAGANGAISEFASGLNNTTVAMGLGMKFKNIIIDGSLAGATSQALNEINFLNQLSITYNF